MARVGGGRLWPSWGRGTGVRMGVRGGGATRGCQGLAWGSETPLSLFFSGSGPFK